MKKKKVIAIFLISSKLFHHEYEPILKDYSGYIKRNVDFDV